MKLLVVDDHAIVREGLRRLINDLMGSAVSIHDAEDGRQALELFRRLKPDIVLLDLNIPAIGGLELLRRLMIEQPTARIIIFSMRSEPIYAARALRLGAKGYLSKGAGSADLIEAIKRVRDGSFYIEQEIATQLAVGNFSGNEDPLQLLSTRELEILRLLGEGKSLMQIAEACGVSYKTVANTCALIKGKLGLQTTAELIRLSIERLMR
ncbi:MAG: response regulator transcription factor [Hyphomicrobiaceae bacterium]|nr:response regulator transcription factor [Hyphomicrobiaceae bacterium]